MSEQNPTPPTTPVSGAQKKPQNSPKPTQSSISDGDRLKQSATDTLNVKKYAVYAGAAAIGLGGVAEAIDAGNDFLAESDATNPANNTTARPGTEDPALVQKKAGRRGTETPPAETPEKPPKPSKLDGKTAKGIGKAGEAIGGGDLLKTSQSDGSIKGDGKEIAKGVKTGADLGTKIGGPVGTAVGAAAGGVIQGLKTKRGRRVIILAWLTPFIALGLGLALIASLFVSTVDASTRPGNDRIASSVNTVVSDGVNADEIDQYSSIATNAGIQWQVLPAIAYQRENAGSIDPNGSAMGSAGPGLNVMTWNICRDSCPNWSSREAGIGARIASANPDLLAIQEGGWSNGDEVKSYIESKTVLTPVTGIPVKGQHLFYNKSAVNFMEAGYVSFDEGHHGAVWARLKNNKTGGQFYITSTHLASDKAADEQRDEQIKQLGNELNSVNTSRLPVVYLGDFNSNKSRTFDAPAAYMTGNGFSDAEDTTITTAVNKKYNSAISRDLGEKAAIDSNHTDHIFVGGGTITNSWKLIPQSPVVNGYYTGLVTDHNALEANLSIPLKVGPAAVVESGDTKPADPVGPMGIDMNQVKELKDKGYPAISRKDAEDKFKSAEYLTPLFAKYLYDANPQMDLVSLESGSEYAESPGNGDIRQEGTSGADQTDSSDIQQAYTTALSKLPIEHAVSNSPQIYSVARSWALGNQVCATNAANGFINDGLWSDPLVGPLGHTFGVMRNIGSVPHEGEDLAAPEGIPIHAAGSGQVIHAGPGGDEGGWAGNWVEITHSGGVKTVYAHMKKVIVIEGQAVTAGQVIGEVGTTGNSSGPHLHFQIHINNKREVTDPTKFMASHGVKLGIDPPLAPGAVAGSGDTADGSVATDVSTGSPVALPQSFTGELATGQKVTLKQFQVNNAAAIVSAGSKQGISDKGLTIAVQVAMQESTLRNLSNTTNVPESANYPHDADGSDHDSVGLFQQRAGWGSVKNRMTPSYAAQAFFGGPKGPNNGSPRGLLDVSGWEGMTNGVAAQTVQVSAFPDAYDKWEPFAVKLVAAVKGNDPMGGTNCAGGAGDVSTAGIVAPSEAAKIAIATAKAQIGVPYSWGGGNKDGKSKGIDQGANTVGFDCSGLTLYAYAKAGIVLPRLSDSQISVGIKVTKADLSPGDLVFWTGHVAMYLGDGNVIHAPRTGKFVEIVPLTQAHSGEPTGYSRPAGAATT